MIPYKKSSNSDIRFILSFPFGLMAEVLAWLAVVVSGNQVSVDFTNLRKDYRDKDA